jgi:hypothetical protein
VKLEDARQLNRQAEILPAAQLLFKQGISKPLAKSGTAHLASEGDDVKPAPQPIDPALFPHSQDKISAALHTGQANRRCCPLVNRRCALLYVHCDIALCRLSP